MVFVIDALGLERDYQPPRPVVAPVEAEQSFVRPAGPEPSFGEIIAAAPPPDAFNAFFGGGSTVAAPAPPQGPSWSPPTRPAARPSIRSPIRPPPRAVATQNSFGSVMMLGRSLVRASPFAFTLNRILSPSEVSEGAMTDAFWLSQQILPPPKVYPEGVAELVAPSARGNWSVTLVPASESFAPIQTRVPQGLTFPAPDALPTIDTVPRVFSSPLTKPYPDFPGVKEPGMLPRSETSPYVETRIVIEWGGNDVRGHASPIVVRNLGPRVPSRPDRARRGEQGKLGKGLYGIAMRVINNTYGAVTEVIDMVEVLAWSVYQIDTAGSAVPAMSLNGQNMHETFVALIEGRAKVDVTGFAIDYAINQLSDAYWALTDAPFDALHRRAPNWGTYYSNKRTQREFRDAFSDTFKTYHDWAEGNLRAIDAGRAARIANLF